VWVLEKGSRVAKFGGMPRPGGKPTVGPKCWGGEGLECFLPWGKLGPGKKSTITRERGGKNNSMKCSL